MRKIEILFLFLIISLIGILLFPDVLFPDAKLSYRNYEFRIGAHPQNDNAYYIRNYTLNYDFKTERGKISFRFFDTQGIGNSIYIEIPPQLEIVDYNISLPESFNCNVFINYMNCAYDGLPNPISFELEIGNNTTSEESFEPNGLFIFGDIREFSLVDNEGYEKDNILLNLNLRNKYRCKENCFIKEMSSEKLDYFLDGSNLIVYLHQGEEGISNPHFRINTYDYQKLILHNLLLTFFISLLAGSLLLLLEELLKRKFNPESIKPHPKKQK